MKSAHEVRRSPAQSQQPTTFRQHGRSQHGHWSALAALLSLSSAFACSGGTPDDSSCLECGGADGNGDADGGGQDGAGGTSPGSGDGSGSGGSAPVAPIEPVCISPVSLHDTSSPAHVVGNGTPESCTGAALLEAATSGGIITFNCGTAVHTIKLDQGITIRADVDTIIDGGGKVELDGQQMVRHFTMQGPDWQQNQHKLVLQRLVLRNGSAPKGEYFPPVEGKPECAYGYKEGSGGAVYVQDGVLEVIDSQFYDNQAALIGPDVGGGAIYILGSAGSVISGSVFKGNRAANGGAIGMLWANPVMFNSLFENNTAEGVKMNTADHDECDTFGHPGQGGAGGLSGAVYFDGMNADGFVYTICGSVFRNNRANELAGALFRTPNVSQRQMLIDRCLFEGNTAKMGGVSFIKDVDLVVRDTTFSENRAGLLVDGTAVNGALGGLWLYNNSLTLENSTFFDNTPSGLNAEESTGSGRNVTFLKSAVGGSITLRNSIMQDSACSISGGEQNVAWPSAEGCPGVVIKDPKLANPANNGGPVPTCAPGDGSAVSGVGSDCPATDQQGKTRDTAACSAGALEL